jgi:hypothetical protein
MQQRAVIRLAYNAAQRPYPFGLLAEGYLLPLFRPFRILRAHWLAPLQW